MIGSYLSDEACVYYPLIVITLSFLGLSSLSLSLDCSTSENVVRRQSVCHRRIVVQET